jgi:hypothetical protein
MAADSLKKRNLPPDNPRRLLSKSIAIACRSVRKSIMGMIISYPDLSGKRFCADRWRITAQSEYRASYGVYSTFCSRISPSGWNT